MTAIYYKQGKNITYTVYCNSYCKIYLLKRLICKKI